MKNALKNRFFWGLGFLSLQIETTFFSKCPKWKYKNFQSEGFSRFARKLKTKNFFTPPLHGYNTGFLRNGHNIAVQIKVLRKTKFTDTQISTDILWEIFVSNFFFNFEKKNLRKMSKENIEQNTIKQKKWVNFYWGLILWKLDLKKKERGYLVHE